MRSSLSALKSLSAKSSALLQFLTLTIALLSSGCGGSSGSGAAGSANTISLVGTPQTISAATGINGPGGTTLPDGNLIVSWGISSGVYIQIGTVSSGVVTGWESPISVPSPSGYTFVYFSESIWDGQLFVTTSLSNNSTGHISPAYMIGTIGAGDVITFAAPVAISISGLNYCYSPSPAALLASGKILSLSFVGQIPMVTQALPV
jgi:hypothetical protein